MRSPIVECCHHIVLTMSFKLISIFTFIIIMTASVYFTLRDAITKLPCMSAVLCNETQKTPSQPMISMYRNPYNLTCKRQFCSPKLQARTESMYYTQDKTYSKVLLCVAVCVLVCDSLHCTAHGITSSIMLSQGACLSVCLTVR